MFLDEKEQKNVHFSAGIPEGNVTFSFAHRQSDYLGRRSPLFYQLLDLDMSFGGITRGDMSIVRFRGAGL